MTKSKRRRIKSAKDIRLELNELYHMEKDKGNGKTATYIIQTMITALRLEKDEIDEEASKKTALDDLVNMLATLRKEKGIGDDDDD